MMKKIFSVLALTTVIIFTACQKEKMEEPGKIPGMGNTEGKLEVRAYDFHEDLVFSPIIGVGETLKSASADEVIIEGVAQGSGDQVIVTLTITNTNPDEWRSAYLRAGTVFDVNLPGYQNGILLAPVVICLSPGETRIVTLYLYCLNSGKAGSDESASYEILGVTQSEVMLDLVNAVKGKMVNYEDYMIYYGEGAGILYNEVKNMLQVIVWRITNGSGMLAEDYTYIDNLPDLPSGVLPEGIYDLDFVLPASWCDGCSLETAWGGNVKGNGKAWWFYYDAIDGCNILK